MPTFKKIKRQTLILNSHSLSYFQRCEQLYKYTVQDKLEPIESYYPFARGALVSKILELWYRAKKLRYNRTRLESLEEKLFQICLRSTVFKSRNGDGLLIGSRLQVYFNKYRDEKYRIVAVEAGFSKVLYEDNYVLFIYEGRPDLVVDFGNNMGIGPVDHKTETMRANIYQFNNQAMGYCWSMGSKIGLYNYIGLQKDFKDGDVLRREAFTFTDSQIEQWKQDTITWYHRILRSKVNNRYLRSWQCDGKYGWCQFHEACESPSERGKLVQIQKYFKEGKGYRSW